ncbi:MAG: AraC family transcriptional regulator ligand-binding domain-containing protein [Alphaproteobacteria bacterium]|nr:AraC family transcriptional regulator ligand-binding domain-containing protein [Alphaproteobacteria bacterium]
MGQDIPLLTASYLKCAIEFAKAELGDRGCRRALADAGLPGCLPALEGFFVPEASVALFLESAARQSGNPSLSARLGERTNVAALGAWGRYIVEGETLGASLERFDQVAVCFCSYQGVRIARTDDLVWFGFRFATSERRPQIHLGLAATGFLISIVRYFAGPDWFPESVRLDVPPPPASPSALEDILPTNIQYDADFIGLALPKELLALQRRSGLPLSGVTVSDALRARHHQPSEKFEAAVEEIIRVQIATGQVCLDAAARSLDLGVRTVQRTLDAAGLDFRHMTSRVRMEIAHEHVRETDLPLGVIAESLGYTNQFNFSRAFRKHFGQSPSKVRKLAAPKDEAIPRDPIIEHLSTR